MQNQSSQFEEILLPPVMLAGLYGQSLVVIEEEQIKSEGRKYADYVLSEANVTGASFVAEEPANSIVKDINPPQKTSWLGNFERQILILVTDNHSLHLSDSELELLSKMLQAARLSLGDIALINTAKQTINWDKVINELPAKTVIFFGVEPSSIGVPMRFPHFRVHRWNEVTFLYSPSLATINQPSEDQTKLKKELWKALQETFNLS
jgi:hypothetical protein